MIGTSKSLSGFDPRTASDCVIWLDASDKSTLTLSGSNVIGWKDKSGNNNNITSVSPNPPIYSSVDNSINFTYSNQNYLRSDILTKQYSNYASTFVVANVSYVPPLQAGTLSLVTSFARGLYPGIGLYVDSNETIYWADEAAVVKRTSNGTLSYFNTTDYLLNFAVNEVNGEIYTGQLYGISKFSPSGTRTSVVGRSGITTTTAGTGTNATLRAIWLFYPRGGSTSFEVVTNTQNHWVDTVNGTLSFYRNYSGHPGVYSSRGTFFNFNGPTLFRNGVSFVNVGFDSSMIAVDDNDNCYTAAGSYRSKIYKIEPSGLVTQIAGGDTRGNNVGSPGDGSFYYIAGLYYANNALYILDGTNNNIKKLSFIGVDLNLPRIYDLGLTGQTIITRIGGTVIGSLIGSNSTTNTTINSNTNLIYTHISSYVGSTYIQNSFSNGFRPTVYANGTISSCNANISNYSLGGYRTGTTPIVDSFTGKIFEFIVFNRRLTDVERNEIEGYLGWKWGIQNSLSNNYSTKTEHFYRKIKPFSKLLLPIDFQITKPALWFDGKDMRTMFSDTSGNVPITVMDGSVRCWKDKIRNIPIIDTVGFGSGSPRSDVNGGINFYFNQVLGINTPTSFNSYVRDITVILASKSLSNSGSRTPLSIRGYNLSMTYPYSELDIGCGVSNSSIYYIQPTSNNTQFRSATSSVDGYNSKTGFRIDELITGYVETVGDTYTSNAYSYESFTNGISNDMILTGSFEATTAILMNQLYVGGRGNGGNYFNGTIYEILIFNRRIPKEERLQIEGYLAHKWNGVSSLGEFVSPKTLSGISLWLDASDTTKFTGGTTWTDKSGNNNHGINAINGTTVMPTITTWTNGLNAARFTSLSKTSMKTTNILLNSSNTIFMVARIPTATRSILINETISSIYNRIYTDSTSFPITINFVGGGNILSSPSISQNQPFLFTFIKNSTTNLTVNFNGSNIGTTTSSNNTNTILNFNTSNTPYGYGTIDIAEIITYNRNLGINEYNLVEQYLLKKWNVTNTTNLLPHSFSILPPTSDNCILVPDNRTQAYDCYVIKYSSSETADWYYRLTQSMSIYSITEDLTQNMYVTGQIMASNPAFTNRYVNEQIIMTNISNGNYITKYSKEGTVLWASWIQGPEQPLKKLLNDSNGDIYLIGSMTSSSPSIQNSNRTISNTISLSSNASFIARVSSSDGRMIWGHGFQGTFVAGNSTLQNIDIFSSNLYVCGFYTSNAAIRNSNNTTTLLTLPNSGTSSGFLVKFSLDGSIEYFTRFGSNVGSIKTTSSGNIYICGNGFMSNVTRFYNANSIIPSFSFPTTASNVIYITSYSSSGIFSWANRILMNGSSSNSTQFVTADSSENVYLVFGTMSTSIQYYNIDGTVNMNTSPSSSTINKFYIVKYSSTGSFLWKIDMNSNTTVVGITVDSYRNLIISGNYRSSISLTYSTTNTTSNISIWNSGTDSIGYILKLSSDGIPISSKSLYYMNANTLYLNSLNQLSVGGRKNESGSYPNFII